jgi:hypothetical protein
MLEHKNEYFFCFSLGKLELLDDLALKLETFTQYRIEIYRSKLPIKQMKDQLPPQDPSSARPTSTPRLSSKANS